MRKILKIESKGADFFCFLFAERRTHEPRKGIVFFLGLRGDGWLKVEDGDGLENGGQKLSRGCFLEGCLAGVKKTKGGGRLA